MKALISILFFLILISPGRAQSDIEGQAEFQLGLTGELYYFNTLSLEKRTNSPDYDSLKIKEINNLFFLNFLFHDNRDLRGQAGFVLDTRLSYASFKAFRAFVGYFHDTGQIELFYRKRVLEFDDGLRLLDDYGEPYLAPVLFYGEPAPEFLKFGQDHYGLSFYYSKDRLTQKNCLAVPADDQNEKYLLINKTGLDLGLADLSANLVFIQQDFTLPEVNRDSWAEVEGVWYEFMTNSMHDPANDNEIRATLEASVNPQEMITLWAEAGMHKKNGGFFARLTQKEGGIPIESYLRSDNFNFLIMGTGVKLELSDIVLETSFIIKNGEEQRFEFDSTNNTVDVIRTDPEYSQVRFNIKYMSKSLDLKASLWAGQTSRDVITGYLDTYNFDKKYFLSSIEKDMGLTTKNRIDLGLCSFLPDARYRKIQGPLWDINSLEVRSGILFSLLKDLSTLISLRFKDYRFDFKDNDCSIGKQFLNGFVGLKYEISRTINVGLDYGLDPVLLHDAQYGFEYALNSYLENDRYEPASYDSLFRAENELAKNHFITIRANVRF
ncbi:MAG: hypothetical protein JW827_07280 [Spirochaetes bacterium]|nr:hypothetical protein [Spirochaetota bacterium]